MEKEKQKYRLMRESTYVRGGEKEGVGVLGCLHDADGRCKACHAGQRIRREIRFCIASFEDRCCWKTGKTSETAKETCLEGYVIV